MEKSRKGGGSLAYQALYRKYRPLTFADVTGQDAVTRTLARQVETNQTTHAYLFTGTRGTGKTSCAKILARAVNCLAPHHGDPCNKCDNCKAILTGQATDILEFDAASHSGVDNIRALRDETVYSPAVMQKRVYIIDEVHMLSIGAFNALLTILEDPPAHVLFILATTETHKVPATILSRCQKFHFKRIAAPQIATRLQTVAQAEGLTLPDDSAALLADWGDGSMRDALSLLERCTSLSQLTAADVEQALGLTGSKNITQLATAIGQSDKEATLTLFNQFYRDGVEVAGLLDELRGLLHRLLVFQVLKDDSKRLTDEQLLLQPQWPTARLTRAIVLLQETLAALPRSVNVGIDAQICLLRLADESLTAPVVNLTTEAPASPPKPAPAAKQEPTPPPAAPPQSAPAKAQPAAVTGTAQPLSEWKQIVASLQTTLPASELSHLKLATAAQADGQLVIYADNPFAAQLLNRPVLLDKVSQAAEKTLGKPIRAIVGKDKPASAAPKQDDDPWSQLAQLNNVEIIP